MGGIKSQSIRLYRPSSIPDEQNRLPVNQQQSVENIAKYYEKIFHIHNIDSSQVDPAASIPHEKTISDFVGSSAILSSSSMEDGPFDVDAVIYACTHIKLKTSVGPDDISPYFIRYGGLSLHLALLRFFNFCWSYAVLPQDFRDSNVLPVYKKAGSVNSVNNYRPISITSVVVRLYERLVLPRLLMLVRPNFINQYQAGFRSKHACYDHLYQLYNRISHTYAARSYLPIAFLDIEKAYDSVWQDALLFKLFQAGIQGAPWRWVRAFISNRRYRVVSQETKSSWYNIHAGVPQGAVLSPLLFVIFINDIFDQVPCNEFSVQLLLFADDIAVVPEKSNEFPSPTSLSIGLALALSAIHEWSIKWKIKFSSKKSAYVWFSRTKHRPIHPSFKLGTITLEESSSYKYLGVIFNNRGLGSEQFNHVLHKSIAASYVVGRLLSTMYSPSPFIIYNLVNVILRSTMSYGLLFWKRTQSMISKLNSILLGAFRRFAGVARNVHSLSVFNEFNMPTLELIEDQEMVRFAGRVSNLPADHPSRMLFDASSLQGNGFYGSPRYPFWSSLSAKYQSIQRKYQACYNRCSFSEQCQVVQVSSHLPLNDRILPPLHYMSPRVFKALQRVRLLHSLQLDKGQGVKAILPDVYDLVNVSMPAYLKHDYELNQEIARFRCRLRLNRGRTNQYLHYIDDNIPAHCPVCGPQKRDTTSHILLECPDFATARRVCSRSIFCATGLPLSLSLLLGHVDTYRLHTRENVLAITYQFLADIYEKRPF